MKNHLGYAVNNQTEVMHYLKSNYPLYHNSNLFLRDVQFGLIMFFRNKHYTLRNRDAEKVARGFLEHLGKQKIVHQLDHQTWLLNYPEFRIQLVPEKPAAMDVSTPHKAL
jgi:hypothetical protein